MERLWSPWRARYIASGVDAQRDGCVFCLIASNPDQDETNFVLHRAEHCFVVLNLYPYITGHLMVVPYLHTSEFDSAPKEITDELMDMTKRSQTALREVYSPSGFNMGMNLGSAAGAGIADHLHIHLLPRWSGDTNFMTTVGESRVIPEDLPTTYSKLRREVRLTTELHGFRKRMTQRRNEKSYSALRLVLIFAPFCDSYRLLTFRGTASSSTSPPRLMGTSEGLL